MDRESIKSLLPIIQAYAEGKTIQAADRTDGCGAYEDIEELDLVALEKGEEFYSYRIKPEPKYRPFKDIKELWNEMLKHVPFGWVKLDTGSYRQITTVSNKQNEVYCGGCCYDLELLFSDCTFSDGSVCGVKEEG